MTIERYKAVHRIPIERGQEIQPDTSFTHTSQPIPQIVYDEDSPPFYVGDLVTTTEYLALDTHTLYITRQEMVTLAEGLDPEEFRDVTAPEDPKIAIVSGKDINRLPSLSTDIPGVKIHFRYRA